MNTIKFAKLSASGNDFVVIDNRRDILSCDRNTFARNVCRQKFGVGADGFLLLEKSGKADFRMRIYNSDGSEAEMCGNGIRCAGFFAFRRGIAKEKMEVETLAGVIDVTVNDTLVKANLGKPVGVKLNLTVSLNGRSYSVHSVNTGVPHAVIFNETDVAGLGPLIRRHQIFGAAGTNADFVGVLSRNKLKVRTFERGVEAETLACGTGAAASAFVSFKLGMTGFPAEIETSGGEIVTIYFDDKTGSVFLEGHVNFIFEGNLFQEEKNV